MSIARFAFVTVCIVCLPVVAADPPKSKKGVEVADLRPAGSMDGKLAALADGVVTIKVPQIEPKNSSKTRVRVTFESLEKEYEFDLASDARFRTQSLPKGADGKAKQFTSDEYAKLREPVGAPGFKADRGDFHAGQIVRVFLGKEGPKDREVAMTVMLLKDAPKMEEKPPQKPKKKG